MNIQKELLKSNLSTAQILYLAKYDYIKNTLAGTKAAIKKGLNTSIAYLDYLQEWQKDIACSGLHLGAPIMPQINEHKNLIGSLTSIYNRLIDFKIKPAGHKIMTGGTHVVSQVNKPAGHKIMTGGTHVVSQVNKTKKS